MFKVIKPDNIVRTDDVVRIPDLRVPLPEQTAELGRISEVCIGEIEESDIYKGIVDKASEQGKRIADKIVSLANIERDGILQQAIAKAEEITRQAKMKLEQAEDIKSSALQQGYNEGVRLKSEEIAEELGEMHALLDHLCSQQHDYFAAFEQELKNLAIDIASKVVHKKISEDELFLSELVTQAVGSIKGAEWISTEISDKLPQLVHKLRSELGESGDSPQIEIRPRDIPEDSCIVKTSEGIIDASVSTQLANLKKYLDSLS